MVRKEFQYKLGNRFVTVKAQCREVDSMGMRGLSMVMFDEHGIEMIVLPEVIVDDIKEHAHQELYEASFEV